MAEAVVISAFERWGASGPDAGLQRCIVKGFKVLNDPMFEEKVTQIVGLIPHPLYRAVVLRRCPVPTSGALSQRSRSALEEGAGGDWRPRRAPWHRPCSSPALQVEIGPAIGNSMPMPPREGSPELPAPHRPGCEKPRDIDLTVDNYATDKTPRCRGGWKSILVPSCTSPTSVSWMNLVERFFAEIDGNDPPWEPLKVDDLEHARSTTTPQDNASRAFVWSKCASISPAKRRAAGLDESAATGSKASDLEH